MIANLKVLAIIPARGGSKGLPGKNIKLLHGKPLLAYTLEAAQRSRYIDRIILSTESEAIAHVAKAMGVDVPFLRPAELATDETPTMDVVVHVMDSLPEQYDILVVLQPTSPLRTTKDIDNCLELLLEKEGNAALSVVEIDHPVEWANVIPEDGRIDNFIPPAIRFTPRQNLPKRYRVNGAVFVAKTDYLLAHRNFFHQDCYAYVMPKERSVDIDDQLDFAFAEFLLQHYKP